jgi:hypothetical protein
MKDVRLHNVHGNEKRLIKRTEWRAAANQSSD